MYPEYSDVPGEHLYSGYIGVLRLRWCFLGTSVFFGYIAILRIHRCSPVTLVFYMSTSVFSGYIDVPGEH
jgi:hypothetical protein